MKICHAVFLLDSSFFIFLYYFHSKPKSYPYETKLDVKSFWNIALNM